jgi:hypothetical protein
MFIPNADSYRNGEQRPEPPKWVGSVVPVLFTGLLSMGAFLAYSHLPKNMSPSETLDYMTTRSKSAILETSTNLKLKLNLGLAQSLAPQQYISNSDRSPPQLAQSSPSQLIKSIALDSPSLISCAQKLKSKPDRMISRIEQGDHSTQKAYCDAKLLTESQTILTLYYRAKRNAIEAERRTGVKKTSATALWSSPLDQNVDKGFRALIAKGLINPKDETIQTEAEMAALAKSVTPGASICEDEEPVQPQVRAKTKRAA